MVSLRMCVLPILQLVPTEHMGKQQWWIEITKQSGKEVMKLTTFLSSGKVERKYDDYVYRWRKPRAGKVTYRQRDLTQPKN